MSDESMPQAKNELPIRPVELATPSRGFDRCEFETRACRVQANMRASGIDVLWLSTEADVRYLSGFLTPFWQSPTRPWHLLLPLSGQPVAVIPAIGEACMQRTWVDDIRTWSAPQPLDDGVSLLIDTLRELAGSTGTIGLPMGTETHLRYPLNDFNRVRHALGSTSLVDATAVLRDVRQIKSPAEVDKLRHICATVSRSFALLPQLLQPGMSERDVFRAFRILCLQQGADDVAYLVGAAGAGGYEDIISPPGERLLRAGDVLILDTGCTHEGYHADFDRNFAIAHVDKASAAAHQRTWDATEAGLAAIAAGQASCASVYWAMQGVLNDRQQDKSDSGVGRLGHGLGIQLTETPSITPYDHSLLLPGMVMTLEPGYRYADDKVMVHEENILITDNGYELLSTRAPRDIPIVDWSME